MTSSGFAFLLDAPAPAEGETTSLHPVARLGKYSDPRYGKFGITRAHFNSWQRNLRTVQNGRIPIDYDHLADEPAGSTKAAGWITGLSLETGANIKLRDAEKFSGLDSAAEYALATIEWTPKGAEAVRDRYYLYVSPTFVSHYKDEQDVDHGATLIGTALTNRPFLRKGMPAISLSAGLGDTEAPGAVADPDAPEVTSDSPDAMTDFLKQLRESLSLPADATDEAVLAATKTLAEAKAPEVEAETGTKTLTEQATAEGKVVLDAGEYAAMSANAEAGATAATELATMRFTTAFDKALGEHKLDAKPETRERFRKIFDADEQVCLDTLDGLAPIVALSVKGAGGEDAEEAPAGVDPDKHKLHVAAKAIQAEKGVPYTTALTMAQEAR